MTSQSFLPLKPLYNLESGNQIYCSTCLIINKTMSSQNCQDYVIGFCTPISFSSKISQRKVGSKQSLEEKIKRLVVTV